MINTITIEVIMATINDDYEPTDSELLLLQDIVRDNKKLGRSYAKELDSVSIMELFDYKVKIDPDRLANLTDKKRLLIKSKKDYKVYKQRF
jgi:hypothetical protein